MPRNILRSGTGAAVGLAVVAGALSFGSHPTPAAASRTPAAVPSHASGVPNVADDHCAAIGHEVVRFARALKQDVGLLASNLHQGEARAHFINQWPPWCVHSLVEKTRTVCPAAFATGDSTLGDVLSFHDEQREEAFFKASADGRWIVESVGVHRVVRVWETSLDGPRLAWLFGPAQDCEPVDGPGSAPATRIVCHVRFEQKFGGDDSQYLLVLDTTASKVHRFDDVEGWQRQGDQLVLASSRRVRRVDWATIAITSDVPLPNIERTSPFSPELLAEGRSVLLGNVLVSLESGAVLARNLEETAFLASSPISPDRSRLLSCVDEKLAFVDAVTGRTQTVAGHRCGIAPAFTADGRHVIGVDETVGRSGAKGSSYRKLTPFVIDVDNGLAQSLPSAAFGITRRGCFVRVYLSASMQGRACVSYAPESGKGQQYYGPDLEGDVCPWEREPSGALARKPQPSDPFGAQALGLAGVELAHATSPDGHTVLVATATPQPLPNEGLEWKLDFAEVSVAGRNVLRELSAVRTGLSLSWGDPPILYAKRMDFLEQRRAVLTTVPVQVIDLAAGTVLQSEGERLVGRWAVSSNHDALIDLVTMKRFPLEPEQAEWRAVKSYGSQCPNRPEDAKIIAN